jgi:hypothetical protein
VLKSASANAADDMKAAPTISALDKYRTIAPPFLTGLYADPLP